jgi:hypothetical protein
VAHADVTTSERSLTTKQQSKSTKCCSSTGRESKNMYQKGSQTTVIDLGIYDVVTNLLLTMTSFEKKELKTCNIFPGQNICHFLLQCCKSTRNVAEPGKPNQHSNCIRILSLSTLFFPIPPPPPSCFLPSWGNWKILFIPASELRPLEMRP